MQIERRDLNDLVVNGLPDGSKVIVDSKNERVYALNATAGAAWDACGGPTTILKVADDMRRSDPSITDEVAEQAVLQLQEKDLVKTTGFLQNASRRQILAGLGAAVALPLVVSMTMGEQKAYAAVANSGQQPPPEDDTPHRPEAHVSHRASDRLFF